MTNNAIAIISAFTALCAVLLGPLVAIRTANIQARIAVLSNNRQVWINTLRDTLAEFSSTARVLGLANEYSDALEKIQRLSFLEEKARLLLNPNEDDHKSLFKLIEEAKIIAFHKFGNKSNAEETVQLRSDLIEKLERMSAISQKVLKREWIRVKNAE